MNIEEVYVLVPFRTSLYIQKVQVKRIILEGTTVKVQLKKILPNSFPIGFKLTKVLGKDAFLTKEEAEHYKKILKEGVL